MAGSVTLEVVTVDKPADMNVIIGQAHRLQALKELPRRPTLVPAIRAVGSWPSGTPAG